VCAQAVYSVLQEAEHRSVTPFPYWNLPLANTFVPRLRKFNVSTERPGPLRAPWAAGTPHMWSKYTDVCWRVVVYGQADLKLINNVLDELISKAQSSQIETDLEDLQNRNYDKVGGDTHRHRQISTGGLPISTPALGGSG
jgi:cytochrome P450 family 97 subfamily B polypeptide 3